MADVAQEASMSRPGMYLVFPSKEEIFSAVLQRLFTEILAEIRQGMGRCATPRERLTFAFELWCVRPFESILSAPDANDILESGYQFAPEVTTHAAAEFVEVVGDVLEPLVRRQSAVDLSAIEIAQLLASAVLGFKQSAQLRWTCANRLLDL
jgi:TetR/AcrR family transcriptional regulator, regulator of autoinduction and epiphytic fitness